MTLMTCYNTHFITVSGRWRFVRLAEMPGSVNGQMDSMGYLQIPSDEIEYLIDNSLEMWGPSLDLNVSANGLQQRTGNVFSAFNNFYWISVAYHEWKARGG
jgi:hypothetical protein